MKDLFSITMVLNWIFCISLATTFAGAMIAVLSARLIRSVSGLAICALGLSGLYYFLHSPFLALMEILIYIGAVCVTIVFAVMLAGADEPANDEKGATALEWGGAMLVLTVGLFWALSRLVLKAAWPSGGAAMEPGGGISAIGVHLLTTYGMAFELISLALLVAIIGALAIARSGRTKP
jgi:NADH-quinone oxidoreductase subunit J